MVHIRKNLFKKVNDAGTTAHPCAHTHKLTQVGTWELSQNEVKVDHVAALSHPVVSYSSWPHGLQHARPPCPSPCHRVCPSSCSLHWWCCPAIASSDALFSFIPQSFPASGTSVCIRWPKYWSFSSSPSSEYSGSISLKIDWFDLLAVQGTFRSLFQHHSLKASILWHSAFFIVQLSQPYLTTGKTIALTIWPFVGRVMFSAFQHIV